MYLDPQDQEKIKEYLYKNKDSFKDLKSMKTLSKMKDKLLKKYDISFHEDIEVEYYKACRLAISEDISRNTGLSSDGITYVIECMGMKEFINYIEGDIMSQHKPSTTKRNGNGSQKK